MTIRWFDTLPSTQDLIHRLAGEGAAAGAAVAARVQTAGRGSRGRGWESPLGGLWLSVLCRPPGDAGVEVLSLRAALAVAGAVEACVTGVHLGIKWPNDLMLGTRKVGGILCEARWQGNDLGWIAIGVGLNLSNPLSPAIEELAVALRTVARDVTPEAIAEPVAEAVAAAGERQGPLTSGELAAFGERDVLRGRRLVAPVPGIAIGVAPDGALLVGEAGGRITPVRSGGVVPAAE
ncbi:MAG: biotin--[acetyl-CoA-carboxylase] ligase [Gemmatimonadota bacterium]|nr:biotin--[acetyl-CoA-carboxylase] ligase [Gemmatimonadota bacterium]MDH5282464.1 biotin--[acetyl-CoA-carboxylase] ligase [Gemmatimonadota bacterium]